MAAEGGGPGRARSTDEERRTNEDSCRITGLTGHLCPFSGCHEVARFGNHFGEPVERRSRRCREVSFGSVLRNISSTC